MKKVLAMALAGSLMLMTLAACDNSAQTTAAPGTNPVTEAPATDTPGTDAPGTEEPGETTAPGDDTPSGGIELALITDAGTIDDKSFNQGSWEGMEAYANDNNIEHQYYQPSAVTDAAYLETISLAVQGGAKVVVTPGFLFETAIYEAQTQYPDVKFILLDGEPHTPDYETYETKENVLPILYAEEQSGFLAGYAAVKDGFTKLGFMGGMAVPAVIRFGHGFVQGADVAAKELGLAAGAVEIIYNYTGNFDATPEKQTQAAGWYQSGTEVIFAAGGGTGNSVMAAAEAATDKWVIGVDVDQYAESPTVISSAMKELGNSVYQALESHYNDTWAGGETLVLDSTNDGVALAMENAKWRSFSQADYDELFDKVVNNTYEIDNNSEIAVTEVATEIVTVNEVK